MPSYLAISLLRDFLGKLETLSETKRTRKFQDTELEVWCLVSQSEKCANHRVLVLQTHPSIL